MTRWHHEKELDALNEVGGYCPKCGAEYRPGFTMCADCNVPLVPGPAPSQPPAEDPMGEEVERDWWGRPVEHEDPATKATEPVRIAVLGSPEEAWLLAGRLRADGFPATVFPPDVSPYVRSYGLQRSFVVLVPKELADEARRAAKPYLEGSGGVDS